MISRFGLLRRNPALSAERFDAHWRTTHGAMAAKMPGLRAYWQHRVHSDHSDRDSEFADLDGLSELHFDDRGSMMAALSSPQFAGTVEDETGFLRDVRLIVCEPRVVRDLGGVRGVEVNRTYLARPKGLDSAHRHDWMRTFVSAILAGQGIRRLVVHRVIERYYRSRTQVASWDDVPVDGLVQFQFANVETAEKFDRSLLQLAGETADILGSYAVESRQILPPGPQVIAGANLPWV